MKLNFSEFKPKWREPDFGKVEALNKLTNIYPGSALQPNGITSLSDWLWMQSPERLANLPAPEGNRIDLDLSQLQGKDWRFVKGMSMEAPFPRQDGWGAQTEGPTWRRLLRASEGDPYHNGEFRGLHYPDTGDIVLRDNAMDDQVPRTLFHEIGHARDKHRFFPNEDVSALQRSLEWRREGISPPDELLDATQDHISKPWYYKNSVAQGGAPEEIDRRYQQTLRAEAVAEYYAQKKLQEYFTPERQILPQRFGLSEEGLPEYPGNMEWF